MALPINVLEKIHVEHEGMIQGFLVWRVNGEFIRDHIDVDFTMGGNPARYGYVPPNEIWLDDNMHVEDQAATIIHEFIEYRLMIDKAMCYDSAHDLAAEIELLMRHDIDRGRLVVRLPLLAANEWLDNNQKKILNITSIPLSDSSNPRS